LAVKLNVATIATFYNANSICATSCSLDLVVFLKAANPRIHRDFAIFKVPDTAAEIGKLPDGCSVFQKEDRGPCQGDNSESDSCPTVFTDEFT
jgi:hypothetical protein